MIASEWSTVEQMLAFMFAYGVGHQGVSGTALLILDSLQSLQARLDVVRAVAEHSLETDLQERFFTKLMPELRRRAGERNAVVHGHWALCATYPQDIILHPLIDPPMRYSVKDLEDIVDRIIATQRLLGDFWHEVLKSKGDVAPTPGIGPLRSISIQLDPNPKMHRTRRRSIRAQTKQQLRSAPK